MDTTERKPVPDGAFPDDWVPFTMREGLGPQPPSEGPYPGVPDWLWPGLWEWLRSNLFGFDFYGHVAGVDEGFLQRFQRRARMSLGIEHGQPASDVEHILRRRCAKDPDLHLALVDARLAGKAPSPVTMPEIKRLDEVLHEAGSLWRVDLHAAPTPMLVRRVSEEIEELAGEHVGTPAGDLLGRAWGAAFGQHPNPSEAYRLALLAVEAVACPAVLPDDPLCTLGKVIGHLRDGESKWRFVLERDDGATSVRPVRETMETLWRGHKARHADGEGVPEVDGDEAEVAVILAATLVHWFGRGFIFRADAAGS